MHPRSRRHGFSLVELMITIAIIGALTALAYPAWQRTILVARRAEAKPNIRGIGDAAIAYYLNYGVWPEATTNPGSPLNKTQKAWVSSTAWRDLNYAPSGKVRCTYYLDCFGGTPCTWDRASAECDVDDDNNLYYTRYYIPTEKLTGTANSSTGYYTETNPENY